MASKRTAAPAHVDVQPSELRKMNAWIAACRPTGSGSGDVAQDRLAADDRGDEGVQHEHDVALDVRVEPARRAQEPPRPSPLFFPFSDKMVAPALSEHGAVIRRLKDGQAVQAAIDHFLGFTASAAVPAGSSLIIFVISAYRSVPPESFVMRSCQTS